MSRAQVLFKAIDILGYRMQNAVHFEDAVCVENIPYGEGDLCKGDLYFRRGMDRSEKKLPVIVYVHGGGFIKGDKAYRESVGEFYADKGYFVYNINYRMPPEAPYPLEVFDCVEALNFLPKLAERYPIDLDSIVVSGDSSGGYMSAYLVALSFNEQLRQKIGCPDFKVGIRAAMLMCGIYDIDVLLKGTSLMGVIPDTARIFLNYDIKDDFSNLPEYQYADCLSVPQHITDKWCATFMCWADDDLICQNQGEPMAEKLEKLAPILRTYHCKGFIHNHCYHLNLTIDPKARECMNASVDFLREVFGE